MNTCDRCQKTEQSKYLVWLKSEDFLPNKKGEYLSEKLYSRYDALCNFCYINGLKK